MGLDSENGRLDVSFPISLLVVVENSPFPPPPPPRLPPAETSAAAVAGRRSRTPVGSRGAFGTLGTVGTWDMVRAETSRRNAGWEALLSLWYSVSSTYRVNMHKWR